MGITLNVWVFSGIIGVAYVMGYLMSRTMGRMLAVEGADGEVPPQKEAVWATRKEASVSAERTAGGRASARNGRETRSDAAHWDERASVRNERETWSGSESQGERASAQDERETWSGSESQGERTSARDGRETWSGSESQGERTSVWDGREIRPGAAPREREASLRKERERQYAGAPRRDETARYGNTEDMDRLPQATRARRAYRPGWPGRAVQGPDSYGGEVGEWQKARVQRRYRSRAHREQQAKPAGHPIASPVAGQVDILERRGRRGVILTPENNKVYAPAAGKIIRLYPRGNEFLLRTDSGVVLRLQAGERDEEMTRDYFRPRIVENEFVGKGKLLLEYDREALARDGYDTHVTMTVEEEEESYDLSVTGSMWVKSGQDCLWVL